MPAHIIRNRLIRALLVSATDSYQRARAHRVKRRGTHQNGVVAYSESLRFRTTEEELERLDRLCVALKIERSVIIRDALDVYLSIAEAEFSENNELPDLAPVVRKPRRKRKPVTNPPD